MSCADEIFGKGKAGQTPGSLPSLAERPIGVPPGRRRSARAHPAPQRSQLCVQVASDAVATGASWGVTAAAHDSAEMVRLAAPGRTLADGLASMCAMP
jgi:hypothetical protein